MQPLRRILGLHLLVLAVAVVGLVGPVHAEKDQNDQPTAATAVPTDVYSAKFLCGDVPSAAPAAVEGPVKPGNYRTAINVHNPNGQVVGLQKKAVLLFRSDKPLAPETPQPPGTFKSVELPPDSGFEIDCTDIRKVLLATVSPAVPAPVFIKGFVVIEVPVQGPARRPPPLDVVPVYTGHGFRTDTTGAMVPEGFALEVVRVPAVRKAF